SAWNKPGALRTLCPAGSWPKLWKGTRSCIRVFGVKNEKDHCPAHNRVRAHRRMGLCYDRVGECLRTAMERSARLGIRPAQQLLRKPLSRSFARQIGWKFFAL